MTLEELRNMPKIELHCHLDGSLSRSYLEERLKRPVSEEEIRVPEDCQSLAEYLDKFALPISCLQDEEGLEKAGLDVMETLSKEHVVYAEIRFAPYASVTETMHCEQVIAAVLRGLEAGKQKYGVSYHVIACMMRHHKKEQNLAVLDAAEAFLGKGVCAVDLAGAEAQYPMSEFMDLFRNAKERGILATIHAGECRDVQNVIDAVEAGAVRIGHGIAMKGQKEVQRLVREKGVGIEVCPISNLHTKTVRTPGEYPLREFLDAGLLVTINTDNRTMSNTSLTRELAFVQETYHVTDGEIHQLMRNALQVAFLGDAEKEELGALFDKQGGTN